jgi:hypothetical protein
VIGRIAKITCFCGFHEIVSPFAARSNRRCWTKARETHSPGRREQPPDQECRILYESISTSPLRCYARGIASAVAQFPGESGARHFGIRRIVNPRSPTDSHWLTASGPLRGPAWPEMAPAIAKPRHHSPLERSAAVRRCHKLRRREPSLRKASRLERRRDGRGSGRPALVDARVYNVCEVIRGAA